MCECFASESSVPRWEWMGIAAGSGGNSLPGRGSQLIPGGFSGRNLQGQRPQEARAVGELGPLQSRFSRQVPGLAKVIL